jgi:hypothetical protein
VTASCSFLLMVAHRLVTVLVTVSPANPRQPKSAAPNAAELRQKKTITLSTCPHQ